MLYNLHCPDCKYEFEAEPWESGKCPMCGKEYDWEVSYAYDEDGYYSDEWVYPEWY